MSNIDKHSVTAKTKELASLMVERFSMNPVSCKLLNEAWEKEFPDEVAIAKRMLALLDELEAKEEQRANWFQMAEKLGADLDIAEKRIAELEAREVILPQVQDIHPLGPQSAKVLCEFHQNIVNRCADEIRNAGVKVSINGD